MAENKKKVVVYTDWISHFNDLTDEELGKLMRHFFMYINDMNPVLNDRILKIAWSPIETTLKRDLKKWEDYTNKQTINGKKGGRPKKPNETLKTQAFIEKPKKGVNVNDNVNVNEKYKIMFEGFRKLYPGTKRGLDTEYENMQKKHKDYKDIIPYLENIIINQIKFKNEQKAKGEFVPQWKNLQTWINNRSWEEVFETHHTTSSRYNPKITSNWD